MKIAKLSRLFAFTAALAFAMVAFGGMNNAQAANPCGGNMNPCAAKKMHNPCGGNMNPCAAKKMHNPCGGNMNPCAAKKMMNNPCAAKKMHNPCGGGMNPCAAKKAIKKMKKSVPAY